MTERHHAGPKLYDLEQTTKLTVVCVAPVVVIALALLVAEHAWKAIALGTAIALVLGTAATAGRGHARWLATAEPAPEDARVSAPVWPVARVLLALTVFVLFVHLDPDWDDASGTFLWSVFTVCPFALNARRLRRAQSAGSRLIGNDGLKPRIVYRLPVAGGAQQVRNR